ncbi:hypothetical protein M9Y10_010359 [Tritrichomonas musculus]|uniref:Uncharacterized protein n=1 Tax=Tritrichomonas musculus TaxID=1915356 RepID=A0ABR2ILP7_9EUKA
MSEGDQFLETESNNDISNHTVSPSVFLQNLTAKVNGFQGGSSNSFAEVQRVRTELSNQLQSVSNKQEMQLRQLDSQLSMLQQEMRPKLQNIERQQGFTQKQLEEIRQRAQKLQMEELSPLQYKFDQLGIRFDRFMRVELESRIKPLQDDLRQSRAKLDELSSTVNTSFRKIDDQVNEMTQKVKNLNMNLNNSKSNYEEQISAIEPRLDALEREIAELSSSLTDFNAQGINDNPDFDVTDDISSQLRNVQLAVNRLQNETIPASIQESSTNLTDALQSVSQFCDDKISALESSLDSITCSNQVVDQQRQQAEEQLNQLHNTNFDVQNKLSNLQDSKSQLLLLEQAIESNSSDLRKLVSSLTSEASSMNGRAINSIDDDIRQLKNSIQASIRKLKETIRVSSRNNLEAQTQMLAQLSQLKNILYGKENAVERLMSAESRIRWCVASIQEIDNERLEAQKINGGPKTISLRIESIEERLASIDSRLNKIEPDKKAKTKKAKKAVADVKDEKTENKDENDDKSKKTENDDDDNVDSKDKVDDDEQQKNKDDSKKLNDVDDEKSKGKTENEDKKGVDSKVKSGDDDSKDDDTDKPSDDDDDDKRSKENTKDKGGVDSKEKSNDVKSTEDDTDKPSDSDTDDSNDKARDKVDVDSKENTKDKNDVDSKEKSDDGKDEKPN